MTAAEECQVILDTIADYMYCNGWRKIVLSDGIRRQERSFWRQAQSGSSHAIINISIIIPDKGPITKVCVYAYNFSHYYDIHDPSLFERVMNRALALWHYGGSDCARFNHDKFCTLHCEETHENNCRWCINYDGPAWLCWKDTSMKMPHETCREFICRIAVDYNKRRAECRWQEHTCDEPECEFCDIGLISDEEEE